MPAAAYLPDPSAWLGRKVVVPPSLPKAKQRPLAKVSASGAPPTPVSNTRPRATNENLPKSSTSRVKPELRQTGLIGYLPSPSATASQPRSKVTTVKSSQAQSSAARGSPISRTAGQRRAIGKPLGSKLAVKTEVDDQQESEEEDQDEIEVYEETVPIAGPSRLRDVAPNASSRKRAKKDTPIPSSSTRRALVSAFSSGELSDAPPEDDARDEIQPVSSPAPRIVPAIPSSLRDTRTERLNAHLDPTQRHAPLVDSQPDLTQLVLTQVPPSVLATHWRMNGMSSDKIEAGEEPWGRSTGYIENAERIEKREKARQRSKLRPEEDGEETEGSEDEAVSRAGQTGENEVARKMANMVHAGVEDLMKMVEEPARRTKEKAHLPAEEQVVIQGMLREHRSGKEVFSPLDFNTGKTVRKTPPPSPSPPRSNKRRRTEVSRVAEPVVSPTKRKFTIYRDESQPGPSLPVEEKSDTAAEAPHSPPPPHSPPRILLPPQPPIAAVRQPSESPHPAQYSLPPAETYPDSIESMLQGVLAEVLDDSRKDAQKKDAERARLGQSTPPNAEVVLPEEQRQPSLTPEKAHAAFSSSPHHHTITPPKNRHNSFIQQNSFFGSLPPAQPSFSYPSWRKAEATQAGRVDVAGETLATWSVSGSPIEAGDEEDWGAPADPPPGQDLRGAEEADADPQEPEEEGGKEAVPVEEPVHQLEAEVAQREDAGSAEELQSLPATVYSYSFPNFFPSQPAPLPFAPAESSQSVRQSPPRKKSRPSSDWESLNRGILAHTSTPLVPATPAPAAPKAKKKGRKSAPAKFAGTQSKLEGFGIIKEKPVKRPREFDADFEDEVEIEEEAAPAKPAASASGPAGKRKKALKEVPDAPYHPHLYAAGVRAMKQREEKAKSAETKRPQTRARTRASDTSSSPAPSTSTSTPRRSARIPTPAAPISSPPPGPSMMSSSVMTDSTEEQDTQGHGEWWREMGQAKGARR